MESSTLTVWGLLLSPFLLLLLLVAVPGCPELAIELDCRGLDIRLIVGGVASSLLAEMVLWRWTGSAGRTILGWEELL